MNEMWWNEHTCAWMNEWMNEWINPFSSKMEWNEIVVCASTWWGWSQSGIVINI